MLHKNTTDRELIDVLNTMMRLPSLSEFRLVGGTALSLQLGHRKSDDIDLFTHQTYGSIDFAKLEKEIIEQFPYVYNKMDLFPTIKGLPENIGISLQVGQSQSQSVKVDIMNWSEAFIDEVKIVEDIRMASVRDIALMKLETISNCGRKKDFWDLSEILERYSLPDLLNSYSRKYPYNSIEEVKKGLTDFSKAEEMPDPICLKNKTWENIKTQIKGKSEKLSEGFNRKSGLGL